jgi:hypothetical protein
MLLLLLLLIFRWPGPPLTATHAACLRLHLCGSCAICWVSRFPCVCVQHQGWIVIIIIMLPIKP